MAAWTNVLWNAEFPGLSVSVSLSEGPSISGVMGDNLELRALLPYGLCEFCSVPRPDNSMAVIGMVASRGPRRQPDDIHMSNR
jgi:hypothetical protein